MPKTDRMRTAWPATKSARVLLMMTSDSTTASAERNVSVVPAAL